jgi:hypothetical protein
MAIVNVSGRRANSNDGKKCVLLSFILVIWTTYFTTLREKLLITATMGCRRSKDGILGHEFAKKTRGFCSMLFTISSTGGFYRKFYFAMV